MGESRWREIAPGITLRCSPTLLYSFVARRFSIKVIETCPEAVCEAWVDKMAVEPRALFRASLNSTGVLVSSVPSRLTISLRGRRGVEVLIC
jgi:hypothetical protein